MIPNFFLRIVKIFSPHIYTFCLPSIHISWNMGRYHQLSFFLMAYIVIKKAQDFGLERTSIISIWTTGHNYRGCPCLSRQYSLPPQQRRAVFILYSSICSWTHCIRWLTGWCYLSTSLRSALFGFSVNGTWSSINSISDSKYRPMWIEFLYRPEKRLWLDLRTNEPVLVDSRCLLIEFISQLLIMDERLPQMFFV